MPRVVVVVDYRLLDFGLYRSTTRHKVVLTDNRTVLFKRRRRRRIANPCSSLHLHFLLPGLRRWLADEGVYL